MIADFSNGERGLAEQRDLDGTLEALDDEFRGADWGDGEGEVEFGLCVETDKLLELLLLLLELLFPFFSRLSNLLLKDPKLNNVFLIGEGVDVLVAGEVTLELSLALVLLLDSDDDEEDDDTGADLGLPVDKKEI
ncbi:unnamed protein product [Ambrosiozyma monospora]|uniref:Unnamed protein product n=1 Tax=Ambrosiozyma monospora TaxID=43982 RepID=A0ACB5U1F6_AMBMO|nr:unnamed protein product [Ambrosiozyma monospora]